MEAQAVTELVRRAGLGDDAAWNAIVDEFANVVWSTVRRFRFNEARAADAVQTTWLRLVEHLASIREPERLAGWLRTTASRVCLELTRESGREVLVESHEQHAASRAALARTTDTNGPEARTIRDEHERLLRIAVGMLPERDQALLDLLVVPEPPNYQQISALLGMPVGSIGPTRARIIARLRTALATVGVYDASLR